MPRAAGRLPDKLAVEIGARLVAAHERLSENLGRKVTLREVGEAIGTDGNVIGQIHRGATHASLYRLMSLAWVYDTTASELLEGLDLGDYE